MPKELNMKSRLKENLKYELEGRLKEVQSINYMRKDLGLPILVPKIRTCLKCEQYFVSDGASDRKCYSCKGGYDAS